MKLKNLINYLVITLMALAPMVASADLSTLNVAGTKQVLFSSDSHKTTPYRIPAIATLKNGDILAISDQRPCGADIGNGEVDIYAKVSKDNGKTWIPSSTDPSADRTGLKIAEGTGNTSSWDCGFGDAAVVVDRESGDVLVICVAGNVKYSSGTSSKHNKMARIRAEFNKSTGELSWGSPDDVTDDFFANLLPDAYTMFMASGRMIQSTKVKVGSHYRVYGALLVKNEGNYVVYSDNFGETWNLLGGPCCSSGDEAKVEELPNGDIVLSSKMTGGRYYNVFNFTNLNNATGSWAGTSTYTFKSGSEGCNGELLLYKNVTKKDGTKCHLLFQSLPTASSRGDVSIFYKEISTDETTQYKDTDFTSGWSNAFQVESGNSAYSTMTILENGEIGFLYEDDYKANSLGINYAKGGTSNIVYVPLTVSEITGGAYTYTKPSVEVPAITPNGGEIKKGNNTITITCATEGATIYYTIDGTTPTTSSTKYTGAFTLSASATVKAIAVKDDLTSEMASAEFTYVKETVATPVITPNGGYVYESQAITLSSATEGAKIYYTTDGTEPTENSTLYTGAFTLSASAIVKAIAVKEDCNNSAVASSAFNVLKDGSTLTYQYRFKNVQKNGTVYYFTYDATDGIGLSTDVNAAALYTRGNGTTSGTYTFQTADGNYLIFSGRNVGGQSCNKGYNDGKGFLTSYESAKCDLTVAAMVAGGEVEEFTGSYVTITGQRDYKKNSYSTATQQQAYFVITSDSKFDGATDPYFNDSYSSAFVIEEIVTITEPEVKKVAAPVFSLPSGTYDEGMELTISCPTEGARIFIAEPGTTPTIESLEVPNGTTIYLSESLAFSAIAILDDICSEVVTREYTIVKKADAPVIYPNGGEIEAGTKIKIYCYTVNTTIHYTIDGTEPTEDSPVYDGPFTLEEDATVKAISVREGYAISDVASADFTIKPEVRAITVNMVKGKMNGYTRYMNTFSAPYDVTVPNTVQVYIVKKILGSVVYFTRVYNNNIPAYTGVLLRGAKEGNVTITEAYEGARMPNMSGNILKHTADEPLVLQSEAYAFGKHNTTNELAFYRYEAGVTIPQYRAYFEANGESKIMTLSFDDDPEVSGIEDVNVNEGEVEYYNLQGVKVENPEKGVYIMKQGGKTTKVVL